MVGESKGQNTFNFSKEVSSTARVRIPTRLAPAFLHTHAPIFHSMSGLYHSNQFLTGIHKLAEEHFSIK